MIEKTCVMRIGSEKSPPEDKLSEGGAGRSFLDGGWPRRLGFVEACLASSDSRSGGLDGPDFEPFTQRVSR